jgi:hypothetical protein
MRRRTFLTSAATSLAAAPFTVNAATPPAVGDLAGDAALLREVLLTLHPGLYRYNSPREIEAGLTRFTRAFTTAPDLDQRYLILSRFLATLQCGHSYANFFNQKKAVATALFNRPTLLPFAFRWIGNRMVVTQLQSSALPFQPGTIIKSINGVKAEDMLAQLLPYARADGNNDAKRRALLSVAADDSIEFFDVFHGLVFGPPKGGAFDLDIIENGRQRRVTMPPITTAVRKSFVPPLPGGDQPIWDWRVTEKGVAILRMDTWALYNRSWKWETWLNDRLDSLNGAKGLIIDLRRNEGGNDCGDLILSRIAPKDIARPLAQRLVRYRTTPKSLDPYLDTWDDSFRDWGKAAQPFDDRFMKLQRDDDTPVLTAKGPRISVPMTVLTSPQNSSATYQFAEICKSTGLGKLIGQPTGGNRRGINGGAFFFVRLPASGLEFDLPLIGYFPEGRQPDAGIVPDVLVAETTRDVALHYDRTLQMALASFG